MTIAGSRREMETVCFDIHIDYLNRFDQKNRFGAGLHGSGTAIGANLGWISTMQPKLSSNRRNSL
jgi:hypothetical protein